MTTNFDLFKEGFESYIDNDKFSDLVINHKGKKYKAHKLIISYGSPYLKNLIDKSKGSEIEIEFDDTDDVFPKLLKFLYTGVAEINLKNVVSMRAAAKVFETDKLGKAVEKYLDANFTKENVFEILQNAITCKDEVVLKKCTSYIALNCEYIKDFKQNIVNLPLDVFFSIIGDEGIKDNQTDKKIELVCDAVKEISEKCNITTNVELLKKTVDSLISSDTLTANDATNYLVLCEEKGLEEQAKGCAKVLALNFQHLKDTSLMFKMKPETFHELVSSDELFIKSEDDVLKIVSEYVSKNNDLPTETKTKIFDCVRYTFLSIEKLKELKQSTLEYIDSSTIVKALWARIGRLEGDNKEPEEKNLRPRKNKVFVYQTDFDKNGILYWLGTNKGTEPYKNPHDRKLVTIEQTANCEVGKPGDLISHTPTKCNLVSKANTEVKIHFQTHKIQPTHYSLRHTLSRDSECLRNWKLSGSEDSGKTWVDIMMHTNDASLNTKGSTKTWKLDPAKANKYFDSFKITQTGNNSSNNTYFSLGGTEIYGLILKK